MITQKTLLNAKLESLLWQMSLTQEYADLDEFLKQHPDIEIGHPFIALFRAGYDNHTRSVRLRRAKAARGGRKRLPPPSPASRPAQDISTVDIGLAGDLLRLMKTDPEAARHDLGALMLDSGWRKAGFPGRPEKFTAEEDIGFLVDARDGEQVFNDEQLLKLRLITQDYLKWLYNYKPAQRA